MAGNQPFRLPFLGRVMPHFSTANSYARIPIVELRLAEQYRPCVTKNKGEIMDQAYLDQTYMIVWLCGFSVGILVGYLAMFCLEDNIEKTME
jgi:hypothetical protein